MFREKINSDVVCDAQCYATFAPSGLKLDLPLILGLPADRRKNTSASHLFNYCQIMMKGITNLACFSPSVNKFK